MAESQEKGRLHEGPEHKLFRSKQTKRKKIGGSNKLEGEDEKGKWWETRRIGGSCHTHGPSNSFGSAKGPQKPPFVKRGWSGSGLVKSRSFMGSPESSKKIVIRTTEQCKKISNLREPVEEGK